jgi:NAD(P)H-dependent flavin oxidoreductase YrpB (nitropropane dioxygenase family)
MGVGISLSRLSSAVANEGGIGVISSVGLSHLNKRIKGKLEEQNSIALRKEIRKAKDLSKGIIGVNIMVAVSDYIDLVKTALEEKVDVIFLGAGLPIKFPSNFIDCLRETKTKFVPIVSSARAANIIFKSWEKSFNIIPDAIVVEGPLAGGHLGFKKEQINDPNYKLENLIPTVKNVLTSFEERFKKNIALIAAGGIYSGKDIYKFLKMGCDGVQLGTRFVATHECDASDNFKRTYINCKEDDLKIIDSPVGLPGRAINNNFLNEVVSGLQKPLKCHWQCLKTCDFKKAPYCIANALVSAQKGYLENGFAFAGVNAHRINSIVSVKELINSLIEEYNIEKLIKGSNYITNKNVV